MDYLLRNRVECQSIANAAACQMAIEGYSSGSCLAGIGGGIEKLVALGTTANERIVIDGCPVACAKRLWTIRDSRSTVML